MDVDHFLFAPLVFDVTKHDLSSYSSKKPRQLIQRLQISIMNETLIIRYSIIMNWEANAVTLWHRAGITHFPKIEGNLKNQGAGMVTSIKFLTEDPQKVLGGIVQNLVRCARDLCAPSAENMRGKWSCVLAVGISIPFFRVRRFNTW
jgi:hypothetical protein